jgi:hypothetical protein
VFTAKGSEEKMVFRRDGSGHIILSQPFTLMIPFRWTQEGQFLVLKMDKDTQIPFTEGSPPLTWGRFAWNVSNIGRTLTLTPHHNAEPLVLNADTDR